MRTTLVSLRAGVNETVLGAVVAGVTRLPGLDLPAARGDAGASQAQRSVAQTRPGVRRR